MYETRSAGETVIMGGLYPLVMGATPVQTTTTTCLVSSAVEYAPGTGVTGVRFSYQALINAFVVQW